MKNLINILKEEIITMRTLGVVFVAVMLVVVCSVSAEAAPVTDRTASVAASGSITAVTSLSVAPATVSYTTTTANSYPNVTGSKVVITYGSNHNPWKLMVYTNNTQVPNNALPDGRYAKGGLATTDGKAVVPVKWVAKIGTNATAPALPTATTYNYVKDKRDEDDPATTGGQDESWAAALAGGYPNIAYGGPSGGFCVDPTNSPTYQGDAVTASSGVALYLAAGWGTSFATPSAPAGAGTYGTNFVIELYHE